MTQCSARVYRPSNFRAGRCARNGTIEENGSVWCKQHAPSNVKKRRDEASRKYEIESTKCHAKWKLEAAAPAMLEALEAILAFDENHILTVQGKAPGTDEDRALNKILVQISAALKAAK